jgi:hypothetical protein
LESKKMPRQTSERRPDPVSFRLDAHFLSLLQERAKGLNTSAGDCARRLVVDGLSGGEQAVLRDEISELRTEVAELRQLVSSLTKSDAFHRVRDELKEQIGSFRAEFGEYTSVFRTVVVALLVGGGRLDTDEALAWVDTNLASPDGGG